MKAEQPIKHNIKNAANTGSWRSETPAIDKEKCTGCGTCVKYCPEACMILKERMKSEKSKFLKKAIIDYKFCKGCGVCAEVCPFKAIEMK